jgi:hypothetical protein
LRQFVHIGRSVFFGDHELAALMEQGGAGNLTLGLTGALYDEIASESREFVRQSLAGRHEVTQKFLRPVRAIRDKLAGLAFLDPAIAPLVGSIDEVLASVPQKGKIDGASLAALCGVVMLLTDPARMREHGRLVLAGEGMGLLTVEQSDPVPSDAAAAAADSAAAVQRPAPTVAGKAQGLPRASAFW